MIDLPILDPAEATDEPPRQRFWRSFSHLRKDPAFQKIAEQEFLPGALDEPGGATRRQFLQLMGASVALAGLTGCRRPVETILPYARKPEEVIPGIPMYYATAMPFRGVLRPLLVESHEGRPTKVEGNPEHPASQGAAGVFEQASVLTLYDPDRSEQVRQDGSEASWQDFVNFTQQFAIGAETKRLAVLCEPTSSPTLRALRDQLGQRFGQVDWVTYEATGDDAEALGYQEAFGQPVRPHYRFSEAEVIVSFDADFLGATARNYVADTREFAASRRLDEPGDAMSRFYIVESTYTNTGSTADHRLRLRASEIPAFAAAVAAQLGVAGVGNQGAVFADHPYVAAIADDLRQAGPRGVVLAGETQPAAIHALCAAINSALGAVGLTVHLLSTGEPASPSIDALRALVSSMRAGDVDALLMIGVNPVYDAPSDLDFAGALQQVPQTIHLGLHVDETARASRWHLPRTHYLEAWGDGRSYDGTLSVIQPLIAPLYEDAKSAIEVVNVLATGLDETGYDLVRAQWRAVVPESFEEGWRRVLHDGFLPDTGYPAEMVLQANPVALSGLPQPQEGLEVVFRLDPTVLDGSFANNGWCQELPDPVTKIVWDNVAVMSPATAEALGVVAEYNIGRYYVDRIDLSVNGQTVNLPVWIVPGHPDDAITVNLGYGRDITSTRPERETGFFDLDDYTDMYGQGHAIATGVGVNVAVLRTADALHVAQGATVQPAGETYTIVTTQDHGTMEDRPLVRMTDLETFRANPDYMLEQEPTLPDGEPWTEYPEPWEDAHPREQPAYQDNPYYKNQWGMAIDLSTCTGCNACIVACNSENNIQIVGKTEVGRGRELHWLRLDRYYVSTGEDVDNPQMVMQPMPCQHCENAPCESVCPVAATVHSPDGTNQMIYNRCIGTRYCSNNCPYKVRRYNWFNWTKTLPLSLRMAQNPNVTVRSRGVMEKCSYCIQRVREVQQRASLEDRPIRDGEVQTACQQACPAQAISFGDLNNPDSEVVRWKQNPRRYEVLAYLNVKPRTSYLGRVRNPNPSLESTEA